MIIDARRALAWLQLKRLLRVMLAVMVGLILVHVAALHAAQRVVPPAFKAGTVDGRGA